MLKIISAAERLQQKSAIKGIISGPSGIGKTSLVRTLDADTTLILDGEAGLLALEGVPVDSIPLRDWETARNLACWIGGANPAKRPDEPYSQAHFDFLCADDQYGSRQALEKYDTIFVDSITVASRLCFQWCKGQPQAFSQKKLDKDGKPAQDMLGAYGLLGQEMIGWLTQLQHTPDKNVWLVGIMSKKTDDYGRVSFELQVEGSKTSLEAPGIVDQIVSMVEMKTAEGAPYRAFVCQTLNEWGYPAKDRSGRLNVVEEPHLGRLMAKIKGGQRIDAELKTGVPAA
jgi:hypothetical protein